RFPRLRRRRPTLQELQRQCEVAVNRRHEFLALAVGRNDRQDRHDGALELAQYLGVLRVVLEVLYVLERGCDRVAVLLAQAHQVAENDLVAAHVDRHGLELAVEIGTQRVEIVGVGHGGGPPKKCVSQDRRTIVERGGRGVRQDPRPLRLCQPTSMVAEAGVTASCSGGFVTVMSDVSDSPIKLAVIVAEPPATAVTRPVSLTVATVSSELDHSASAVTSAVEPSA